MYIQRVVVSGEGVISRTKDLFQGQSKSTPTPPRAYLMLRSDYICI